MKCHVHYTMAIKRSLYFARFDPHFVQAMIALTNDAHPDRIKREKPSLTSLFFDTPKGIRIPVASVKGRCPRPLDDGGLFFFG